MAECVAGSVSPTCKSCGPARQVSCLSSCVPRTPDDLIMRLPGENVSAEVGQKLDSVLTEMLQKNRKAEVEARKTGRGAKISVIPGRAIG